jgi:NitT/TauT family transport system substrate-binding protein
MIPKSGKESRSAMPRLILGEPFRAVFYAPYYVADALDTFGQHGLEVQMVTAGSADLAAQSLLDGATDVAWSGPMRPLLERSRNPGSPLRSFCGVVMRDPFFLVGREDRPSFRLADLAGLRLGVTSEVPTPWWCLQHDLRREGIGLETIDLVEGQTMRENTDAVLCGEMDVALLFEPLVSEVEAAGGAVWYAAAGRGPTAYSALYATTTRMAERRDAMVRIVCAMIDALDWVAEAESQEIAQVVASRFPNLSPQVLLRSLTRYKSLGLWSDTPVLPPEALDRLAEAMISAGVMEHHPGYAACIDSDLVREGLDQSRVSGA